MSQTAIAKPDTKVGHVFFGDASTDELKQQLSKLLAQTADDLSRMAAIVAELESRGEDLAALKIGLINYLRRIAAGQLLPEVVVKFAANGRMLEAASVLPLADQRTLLSPDGVEIAVRSGKAIEWRHIDPVYCSPSQCTQLIAPGRLRAKPEQVNYLEGRREPAKRKKRPAAKVQVSRGSRTVKIGHSEAAIEDVLAAMATAGGWRGDVIAEDHDGMETAVASAVLTADEMDRLRSLAAATQTDSREIVRRAILAFLI